MCCTGARPDEEMTVSPPASPAAEPAPVDAAVQVAGTSRLVPALLAATLVVTGSGVWAASRHSQAGASTTAGGSGSGTEPVATPSLRVRGMTKDGAVAWQEGLELRARDGELTSVTTTGPGGAVAGKLTGSGTWRASGTVLPSSAYSVTARVRDAAGDTRELRLDVRTTAATQLLTAGLSPGDDRVVGVGQPVVVRLSRAVEGEAARAALVKRLSVHSTPEVDGAWRWMSSTELHYRGARFWPAGTQVRVVADLDRLPLPGGVWGSERRTTSFTVGSAVTSVVDTRAHTMTVSRGGKVLRVLKASMGKPAFATRNGTFLVLEKFEDRIMDSATVDLPPGTPAYRTAVKHAVRISNSGTFTHGAPWSVKSQGKANVSHGCVNLSPADAKWFYGLAKRGDVVEVVHSTRGPLSYDAGSQDWNMSYAAWRSGS